MPASCLMHPVMKRVYLAAPGISLELIPFNDRAGRPVRSAGMSTSSSCPTAMPSTIIRGSICSTTSSAVLLWTETAKIGLSLSLGRYLGLRHVTAQFSPIRRPFLRGKRSGQDGAQGASRSLRRTSPMRAYRCGDRNGVTGSRRCKRLADQCLPRSFPFCRTAYACCGPHSRDSRNPAMAVVVVRFRSRADVDARGRLSGVAAGNRPNARPLR